MCKNKKSSEAAHSFFCLKLSSKKFIKLTLTWQAPRSPFHLFLYCLSAVQYLQSTWHSLLRTKYSGTEGHSCVDHEYLFLTDSVSVSLNVQTEKLIVAGKAVISFNLILI